MSDLGDARRALRRDEAGEALVHLWNALEQARGTNDPETLARIAALAQQVEEKGDEGERAEAEQLLEELRDEADLVTEEADEVEEEAEPTSRRRAALGWLIPIAIFLFFTLRDVLS